MTRYADRPAVLGINGALDYSQLGEAVGGVARLLSTVGARPGDRVATVADHGRDAVVAALGALAAGCCYVPLDPTYPVGRLAYMLDHADVDLVLAGTSQVRLAEELRRGRTVELVRLDDATPAPLSPTPVDPDQPAYVLHTSGSTGRPKAVAQTHRNLLHCVGNQVDSLAITADDRLSLLASLSFDAAVPDLYSALLTGASLVPVDIRGDGIGPAVQALAASRVTVYHSTPTVFRHVLATLGEADTLADLRVVLLGGEPLRWADVIRGRRHVAPSCRFVNGYGSTEVTFSAQYQVPPTAVRPDGEPVPIGRALPGYELEVPDQPGGLGELVVGGDHVVGGYWRDPERSADRFGTDSSGRSRYRTGDLVRRLPDGNLVCLGRVDRQVKVRGFRVEPGEVEIHLAGQPGVRLAAVTVRGEALVGYVEPTADGPAPDPGRLRRALAAVLPDHLVPGTVVVLDALPLTPSGKVDVRALPDPEATAHRPDPPRTSTERLVHDVWCEVLGVATVGRRDGFFDVGGHSLALGQVQQRLAEVAGIRPAMVRLLGHPTVEGHARVLDAPDGVEGGASGPGHEPEVDPEPVPDDPGGDEIAVVGLAGRFPGGDDVTTFWQNLLDGVDSVHDFHEDELVAMGIGPGLLADPLHVRSGGWVRGTEDVDTDFFGLDPDEAARTDPQHRLFLEAAWAALEDAGHDPRNGPSVGVFAAASANRYFLFHLFDNPAVAGTVDPDDWEARLLGRQLPDHLPGQVAYRLGLTGPSMAVQSACSSSLAAVCLAAQSLLDLRCDLALAGGVSVSWPRYRSTADGLVSPDGRCRAFDAGAQGSGFSSGVGVVALKRLADALADDDHIHAVLSGWSLTNDGADRAGFAVPGLTGQAAAAVEALASAGVAADEVGMIEAHGSATLLGDAIEMAALSSVYGGGASGRTVSCPIGSVKTNIGHLDAGAGVAGLIKAVLAVRDGQVPASLHYTEPNPEIDLPAGPFHVPSKLADWPTDGRRVAAVNAFGLGGANAHVIVEQPPERGPAEPTDRAWVLPVSARCPAALRDALARLSDHLATARPALADVAHTLALGRREFAHRAAVVATDVDAAAAALSALAADLPQDPAVRSGAHDDGGLLATARRWVQGAEVDWAAVQGRGRRIPLPTYPFQRRRCWIEPRRPRETSR